MLRSTISMVYKGGKHGPCMMMMVKNNLQPLRHFWISSAVNKRLSTSYTMLSNNLSNVRWFTGQQQSNLSEGERYLIEKLESKIPDCSKIEVKDVSGGCGEMYEIFVVSSGFKGLSTLQQHRMVTEALEKDIPKFHGVRIQTSITSS